MRKLIAGLILGLVILAPLSAFGAGSKTNAEETRALQRAFLVEGTYADTTTYRSIILTTVDPTDSSATAGAGECAYTSYARQYVPRTAGGWTVSGNSCTNAAAITFPTCTGGPETIHGFKIIRTVGAVETILYWGTLTSDLSVSTNVQPQFAIGALTITED